MKKLAFKRALSLALVLLMALSLLPLGGSARAESAEDAEVKLAATSFTDVPSGIWYYDAVNFVVDKNLFQGTGASTFSPDVNMTRGMFVTVLGRIAGIDKDDYTGSDFSDVDAQAYYAPYVKWASGLGIVSGTGSGRFEPNKSISRQDLTTILYRYVTVSGGDDFVSNPKKLNAFSDYSSISSYAMMAMSWAVDKDIMNGSNGKLVPFESATRAQVAQIVSKAYDKIPVGESDKGDLETQSAQLSEALDKKISELTSNGTKEVASDTLMQELGGVAESLAAKGVISNVEYDSGGILFVYGDGTIGQIVMELPQDEDATTSSLSAPTAFVEEPEAELLGAPNVIGLQSILWLNDYAITGLNTLDQKLGQNPQGLSYTYKPGIYYNDLLSFGSYGVVIVTSERVFHLNNLPWLGLSDTYNELTANTKFRTERREGLISLCSVISPDNPTISPSADAYLVTAKSYKNQFRYTTNVQRLLQTKYSAANSLPNNHIHLGFHNSLHGNYGISIYKSLLAAGAGCVTGYTDLITRGYDLKVLHKMVDVMLYQDTPHTAREADIALEDAGLHKFSCKIKYMDYVNKQFIPKVRDANPFYFLTPDASAYKLQWWEKEETQPSNSPIQGFPGTDKLTDYEKTMGGTEMYYRNFTFDVRNNGDTPITGFHIYWLLPDDTLDDVRPDVGWVMRTTGEATRKISVINPGETSTISFTFMLLSSNPQRIVITRYCTGDPDVEENWKYVDASMYEIITFKQSGY